jgi:hypothetical protein
VRIAAAAALWLALAPAAAAQQPYTVPAGERLRLDVHQRGRDLRVTVHDRWHAGGVQLGMCLRPPRRAYRCRPVLLAPGQWEVSRLVPARRRGRWTVLVSAPDQALLRRVTVRAVRPGTRPLVLATGDSMMLTLASVLEQRPGARVRDDIYIGSGIGKPDVVDWARLPAKQLRAEHQDATVITLGMGDVYPLGDIPCCGEDWTAEYARRARRMMRAYTRRGAALMWLNLPYPRDPRHAPAVTAVNTAVATAAAGLPRVRVLDLATMLTPGSVYRQSLTRDGRRIRLRRADGVHLAVGGARLVARRVRAALTELGVLPTS